MSTKYVPSFLKGPLAESFPTESFPMNRKSKTVLPASDVFQMNRNKSSGSDFNAFSNVKTFTEVDAFSIKRPGFIPDANFDVFSKKKREDTPDGNFDVFSKKKREDTPDFPMNKRSSDYQDTPSFASFATATATATGESSSYATRFLDKMQRSDPNYVPPRIQYDIYSEGHFPALTTSEEQFPTLSDATEGQFPALSDVTTPCISYAKYIEELAGSTDTDTVGTVETAESADTAESTESTESTEREKKHTTLKKQSKTCSQKPSHSYVPGILFKRKQRIEQMQQMQRKAKEEVLYPLEYEEDALDDNDILYTSHMDDEDFFTPEEGGEEEEELNTDIYNDRRHHDDLY